MIDGPAAPNLDTDFGKAYTVPEVVARYRALNRMAGTVAANYGVAFVDRWDAASTEYFVPGTLLPSAHGHSALGELLAKELLTNGFV